MQLVVFALTLLWLSLAVAVRRLFRGPLHQGWSYRYETLIALMRRSMAGQTGVPIEVIRKRLLPSRIPAAMRALLTFERGTLAGRRAETFTPKAWKEESDPTLLYLHGGGYIMCSPSTHRDLVSRIAVATGARTIALDYRKAPEHPFPIPVDDAEAGYRELLAQGADPARLFVGGDSAGGGLALALLQRLRDAGVPLPRGGILLSPWVDLECLGESIPTNSRYDYLPADGLTWGREQYLQGQDFKHPHVSAVHADVRGLPPLLMQTGSAELFLAENLRFASVAREAGVTLTHEVEPGGIHVFQAFATWVPECEPAILRIGAFVRDRLVVA